jgi:hypothetical protein
MKEAIPFAGFWWSLLAFVALTASWTCGVGLRVGPHWVGCQAKEVSDGG